MKFVPAPHDRDKVYLMYDDGAYTGLAIKRDEFRGHEYFVIVDDHRKRTFHEPEYPNLDAAKFGALARARELRIDIAA